MQARRSQTAANQRQNLQSSQRKERHYAQRTDKRNSSRVLVSNNGDEKTVNWVQSLAPDGTVCSEIRAKNPEAFQTARDSNCLHEDNVEHNQKFKGEIKQYRCGGRNHYLLQEDLSGRLSKQGEMESHASSHTMLRRHSVKTGRSL